MRVFPEHLVDFCYIKMRLLTLGVGFSLGVAWASSSSAQKAEFIAALHSLAAAARPAISAAMPILEDLKKGLADPATRGKELR